MIRNDQELTVTQERIASFERLLAQLRVTAQPHEFSAVAGGYRAEIEKMHHEVLEYLTRHATEPVDAN
jgi:predicted phosphoribosyltransferase